MFEIAKEINNISEYIEFIYAYKSKCTCELWYRGHNNNNWRLDASINRTKKIDVSKSKLELDSEQVYQNQITSLKYKNITNFMQELIELKKNLKGKIPKEFNNFHLMFLGQHYKLETPALDWSTDPLVALHFALYDYKEGKDMYPVIFILKPGMLNANSSIVDKKNKPICEPLVIDSLSDEMFNEWFSDPNNTPFSIIPLAVKSNLDISYRISRQSGVFTLMDTRQPLHYPWIQTSIEGEPLGITLKINPNSVEDIRMHLESLNIKDETIKGESHKELDILCENIKNTTSKI